MKKIMKNARIFFTTFLDIIRANDLFALGGQITYYAILSFFPLLISVLNVLSYFSMHADFFTRLQEFIPDDFADIIIGILEEMVEQRNIAVISIGTLTSIWAASRGIEAMLRPLHHIYQIPPRSFFKLKTLSLLFYLVLIVALMLSFSANVLGNIINNQLVKHLGQGHILSLLWQNIRVIASFLLLVAVFLLMNRLVTGAGYTLRKLLPGALASALGWLLLSFGFSIYVNNVNNYSIVYGSLAGVMLLLLWLYWSAEILLFGAVFNVALDGSYTPPSELMPP